MTTVLITGANGQMGSEFRLLARSDWSYRFIFTDIAELNITDEKAVNRFFHQKHPDVIINCAGYTAVDKAEEEPGKAMLINATAPGILAREAALANALLIHISTDYVFNGFAHKPYTEEDLPDPLSAYAKSKYEGEKAVIQAASRAVILRTSWLYSAFGNNFVKTILKYGNERDQLRVIFDQTGTPTYAADLCEAILQLIPRFREQQNTAVFHYSNEGVASWYDFAAAILELAGVDCQLFPIKTSDYPLPAKRPYYSVMNKEKIKQAFDLSIPYWRSSLQRCLKHML